MNKLVKGILTLGLLLGTFSYAATGKTYISKNTVLKASNGKTAQLYIGIAVTVVKKDAKVSTIAVNGFQNGKKIYFSKGESLVIATLNNGFTISKEGGNKVKLTGTVASSLLTTDHDGLWADEQDFYEDTCTQCHAERIVEDHSMKEWEALFAPMKIRAQISPEEASALLRYLKSNAKNGIVRSK